MRFENQILRGDITLDHNEFVNCTFEQDCRISYHGGPYAIRDCNLRRWAAFRFEDSATNMIAFLKLLGSLDPRFVYRLLELETPPKSVSESVRELVRSGSGNVLPFRSINKGEDPI